MWQEPFFRLGVAHEFFHRKSLLAGFFFQNHSTLLPPRSQVVHPLKQSKTDTEDAPIHHEKSRPGKTSGSGVLIEYRSSRVTVIDYGLPF